MATIRNTTDDPDSQAGKLEEIKMSIRFVALVLTGATAIWRRSMRRWRLPSRASGRATASLVGSLRRQLLQGAVATTLIAAVPAVSLADYHTMTARERYEESVTQYESQLRDRQKTELPPPLYGSTNDNIYFNPDGSATTGGIYFTPDGSRAIYVDDPVYSLGY